MDLWHPTSSTSLQFYLSVKPGRQAFFLGIPTYNSKLIPLRKNTRAALIYGRARYILKRRLYPSIGLSDNWGNGPQDILVRPVFSSWKKEKSWALVLQGGTCLPERDFMKFWPLSGHLTERTSVQMMMTRGTTPQPRLLNYDNPLASFFISSQAGPHPDQNCTKLHAPLALPLLTASRGWILGGMLREGCSLCSSSQCDHVDCIFLCFSLFPVCLFGLQRTGGQD